MTAWEKLLPTFDFSFHADRADSKPSSTVQSPPICARSFFFLFSLSSKPVSCDVVVIATSTLPRPHTGNIPLAPPRHCNYRTNRGRYNHRHVTLCRSQAPTGLTLTCIAGTHKPPRRRRPHCA